MLDRNQNLTYFDRLKIALIRSSGFFHQQNEISNPIWTPYKMPEHRTLPKSGYLYTKNKLQTQPTYTLNKA